MLLVNVADFFDIVVMPVSTAYIALALVRLPVIYGRAVTDKAHIIVTVIKKGLQATLAQRHDQPNHPLAILLTACPLVVLRQSASERF